MESLILAQNERWQRGLGMQVEREAFTSSFRTRRGGGKWRKGEERVSNLPLRPEQLCESGANTGCGLPTHVGKIKGGDPSGPVT